MPPTEQNHTPRMRLRTLIVEDSASDARLMENVLRDGGYDVVSERVYTADTLRAALERGPWDIVISDYHLPQFDGPDALQLLQFHAPDIPFIMVSGAVGEESAAGAIRAGADDFLLKSNLGRLVAVVERVLRDAAKRRQSKRMEEALRRSEERYRAVVEDQTELISRYRQDGTLMFVNEVFCRFFGKTSQELLGAKWQPQAVTEDIPLIEEKLRTLSPANPVVVIENRVRSANGEVCWMQFVNRGFFDADGRLMETQSVGRDITERKRAEEALRASEDRYHALFATSVDAVLLTAPDGRIFAANAAACRIFGYSEEELIRLGRSGVVDVLDPYLQPALEERNRTGKFAGQLTFLRSDGTKFPGEISSAVFRNQQGELRSSMVIRDITERKQAEEALHELSGRLLRLQDQERRRIARELHDTTAQQLVALCLGLSSLEPHLKALKPKTRKLFDDYVALADQCLAEIRTKSYLLHPPLLEELGLAGAMRDYADGFAQRSGIRVDLDLPLDLRRLSGEAELALFRVLQESLGNVHRHSGSRTASIRLSQTADDIRLEVQDAGHGSAVLAGADEKNATNRLGVGINGMRERLRQLGGRLEIDSSNDGTTVRAVLPLPETKRP